MDNIDKDILGVNAVSTAFAKMGWTLRERGRIDYGIDADVEVKSDGKYQNKHIALQIKSGDSYLKVKKNGKISYSVDEWHYKYWLKSDRPVLILFYDIDKDVIIWEHVCLSNLKLAKSNHIIEIEPSKQLTINSKDELDGIISNYQPFEDFEIDSDCVNFEYSIYCYKEIEIVLESIISNIRYFRNKINAQTLTSKPNTNILIKLFKDFTRRLSTDLDLTYENYCKSYWYIDKLTANLNHFEKNDLNDIIDLNIKSVQDNIRIFTGMGRDFAIMIHANIPFKLQQAAKNLIFRINEHISMMEIIIDTQNSIQNKLKI